MRKDGAREQIGKQYLSPLITSGEDDESLTHIVYSILQHAVICRKRQYYIDASCYSNPSVLYTVLIPSSKALIRITFTMRLS